MITLYKDMMPPNVIYLLYICRLKGLQWLFFFLHILMLVLPGGLQDALSAGAIPIINTPGATPLALARSNWLDRRGWSVNHPMYGR